MTVSVATNLAALRADIAAIDRRYDHEVAVVAVTKGFGGSAIDAAVDAGAVAIGENYAQEIRSKRDVIEARHPEVHFIGRLQSNKVRQLVGLVDVWSSLDRHSVIAAVARRSPRARVRIQVNTSVDGADAGKGGAPVDAVPTLVEAARAAELVVEGLMTVGPTGGGPEAARPGFAVVRRLVDELGLVTCSMGMSGDLRVAVEEGSTEVRIGTALFGPRPVR